ncbi:hypothetical protein E8E14_004426 [Neopestalotiopsis sp. 37M]|nr:hypothetical protein E8E14_004426 [Neopestalotiopsis sp. 37M]
MSQSTEEWTWKDPPFGVLLYNANCNATTDYYANSIMVLNTGDFLDNNMLGDLGYLTSWLGSVLPDDWNPVPDTNRSVTLSYEGLFDWYMEVWANETYYSSLSAENQTIYDTFNKNSSDFAHTCDNKSICNKLDIKGDPDVSGRGMLMAYCIRKAYKSSQRYNWLTLLVLGLATIYFFALLLKRLLGYVYPFDNGDLRKRTWRRLASAFEESVDRFLNAALVFAAAMLAATVARYFIYLHDRARLHADDVWTYTLLGSAFTSIFCVFPCLVIQTVEGFSKPSYQRLFLWSLVAALSIAVEILFHLTFQDIFPKIEALGRYDQFSANDYPAGYSYEADEIIANEAVYQTGIYRAMIWEQYCSASGMTQLLRTLVDVGFGLQAPCYMFFLLAILMTLIPVHIPIEMSSTPNGYARTRYGKFMGHLRTAMMVIRPLFGLVFLAVASFYLGEFIIYRRQVKRLAPSTDADSDWSFGQILALAQWVPVALDFMHEWKNNPNPAVESDFKVLQGYEHVYNIDEHSRKGSYKRSITGQTV